MKNFDKFFDGFELEAYKLFGAHRKGNGVEFTLWAPHAYKVEVISSYDDWQNPIPMQKIDYRGVWNLFVDNMDYIYSYRYRIFKDEFNYHDKIDPYAFYSFHNRLRTEGCAEK